MGVTVDIVELFFVLALVVFISCFQSRILQQELCASSTCSRSERNGLGHRFVCQTGMKKYFVSCIKLFQAGVVASLMGMKSAKPKYNTYL